MRRFNMILLVAGLILPGCGKKDAKKAVLNLEKMSVPVTIATARDGQVNQLLEIGGKIEALQTLDIVPDMPGRVKEVLVKEGDLVKKGQVLAVLDTKQVRIQSQQVGAAVAAAGAQLENARKQLIRTRQLYKKGAVTKQQLDAMNAAFKAASAGMERARAARALATHAIAVSTMKAPFNGVITGRFRDPGDMINPLMQSLSPLAPNAVVRLARLDEVLVDGFVSDQNWSWLKKGMPAFVMVDAWKGRKFKGRITKIAPAANALSGTFAVEVSVKNEGLKLRPGMYARLSLTKATQKGVVVPLDALVKRSGKFIVFTVDKKSARLHQVSVGLQSDMYAIISKGIKAGEQVVVQGNIALREGSPIRVIDTIGEVGK